MQEVALSMLPPSPRRELLLGEEDGEELKEREEKEGEEKEPWRGHVMSVTAPQPKRGSIDMVAGAVAGPTVEPLEYRRGTTRGARRESTDMVSGGAAESGIEPSTGDVTAPHAARRESTDMVSGGAVEPGIDVQELTLALSEGTDSLSASI